MTVAQALASAGRRLREAGCPGAASDASIMLREALGLGRTELLLSARSELSPDLLSRFELMVGRRLRREPVQYIVGSTEFLGLKIACSPAALIPRPETETVFERFTEALPQAPSALLDVGTGTGALAIALALRYPGARVTGCDISAMALALAGKNASALGADVAFVVSDLLGGLGAGFDGIVANLPYIRTQDMGAIQPEVRLFEPRLALDGGLDGLDAIRQLMADAPRCLKCGGVLALEASGRQPGRLVRMMRPSPVWREVRAGRDLAGRPRWVLAVRA